MSKTIDSESTQKLEILGQFIRKYPDWVNEDLVSLKYCQSAAKSYLEMYFCKNVELPVIIDLAFIAEPDKLTFDPDQDIIDNAKGFVELDTYSLINCIENLFSHEAELLIDQDYRNNHTYRTSISSEAEKFP